MNEYTRITAQKGILASDENGIHEGTEGMNVFMPSVASAIARFYVLVPDARGWLARLIKQDYTL